MLFYVPIHSPKWDSFRLEIPIEKVKILHRGQISKELQTIEVETGAEVEAPFIKMSQSDYEKGIVVRILKQSRTAGFGVKEDRLIIQLSAKYLGSDYFLGINKETISKAYEYLLSRELVFIEWEDFLDAKVYDADLCMDFNCEVDEFRKLCSMLHLQINPTLWKKTSVFREETNLGIEIGKDRRGTIQTPYWKMYHKGLELIHKKTRSQDGKREYIGHFNESYLGNEWYGYGRMELTFKNVEYFEYYGFGPVTTLNHLLNCNSADMERVMKTIVREKFIMKRARNTFSEDNRSPSEKMLLSCFDYIISLGEDEDWFIAMAKHISGSDTQRSRNVNKVKKLLDDVRFKERLVANQRSRGEAHKLGVQLGFWDVPIVST